MKQIHIILLYTIILGSLSGCKKFLAEDPKSLIATTTFYKTDADAVSAMNGVYGAMRPDIKGNIDPIWLAEMTTDDVTTGGTPVGERLEIENLVYSSQHNFIRNTWNTAFNVINRANSVLYYVDSSHVTPSLTRRIYGEARFLRAFYYARLVQFFGAVPLLTTPSTPDSLYPGRTPVADIYNQIIADLKYAEQNLADNYTYKDPQNGGRATAVAAKSLLGYVYMVMAGYPTNDASKWQLAADKLNEVISNKTKYGVDIQPVYKDIFDATKKATNKEYIFYYAGTAGLSASLNASTAMQFWHYNFPSIVPSKEVSASTSTFYEANDQRKLVNLAKKSGTAVVPVTNASGTIIIGKYIDNIATSSDNACDFHILRYSDVLLMHAESLIEISGTANMDKALSIINTVRTAHGGASLPLLTYTSQDDLRQKLRLERRKELLFEGKRWYDLKRWGILVPTMKDHMAREYNVPVTNYSYIDDTRLLFPLPYIDITANPNLRPQNAGY